MSKPMLPTRPKQDVDVIAASWIGKLLDCVKYAMDYPKGDNKTTRREGGTIMAIPRSGGIAEGGDTYKGYFKVANSTEAPEDPEDPVVQTVKITSGYAVINNKFPFEVIDNDLTDDDGNTYCAELEISGTAYVYLQATYNSDAKTVNEPTIEQAANFPTPSDNAYKHLICVIEWDSENSVISDIIQQNHGVIEGIIPGTC